jgi:hypothetical protein
MGPRLRGDDSWRGDFYSAFKSSGRGMEMML